MKPHAIFKKRSQQTLVALRQVSTGSGAPDTLLLLWVSKMHHITAGPGDHEHSIPARLTVWPLGQKPGSGQCAGAHIWGLPLLHGGESWTARGCHPDSDWLTQDSGLTSGEKKPSQTKYISWPLNRTCRHRSLACMFWWRHKLVELFGVAVGINHTLWHSNFTSKNLIYRNKLE